MVLKNQIRLLKLGVWLLGLLPGAWLLWRGFTADLGANPYEELLLDTGRWTLIFLLTTLAITPLRKLLRYNPLGRVRRLVGLFAFGYACSHLLTYVALDQAFDWPFIVEDIAERPFITAGFAAWLVLVPLAATSTRGWIRRLGKSWQRLHRLVYLAGSLGVLHFFWKVKADTRWPLVATGVLLVLLAARVPAWLEKRKKVQPSEA